MEIITIEVNGIKYEGYLEIINVDKNRIKFNLSFDDQYHQDSSMFYPGSENQIRVHAKYVLEKLVKEHLKK